MLFTKNRLVRRAVIAGACTASVITLGFGFDFNVRQQLMAAQSQLNPELLILTTTTKRPVLGTPIPGDSMRALVTVMAKAKGVSERHTTVNPQHRRQAIAFGTKVKKEEEQLMADLEPLLPELRAALRMNQHSSFPRGVPINAMQNLHALLALKGEELLTTDARAGTELMLAGLAYAAEIGYMGNLLNVLISAQMLTDSCRQLERRLPDLDKPQLHKALSGLQFYAHTQPLQGERLTSLRDLIEQRGRPFEHSQGLTRHLPPLQRRKILNAFHSQQRFFNETSRALTHEEPSVSMLCGLAEWTHRDEVQDNSLGAVEVCSHVQTFEALTTALAELRTAILES
jgi:hypothetical protein